jgi:hypothetical protein
MKYLDGSNEEKEKGAALYPKLPGADIRCPVVRHVDSVYHYVIRTGQRIRCGFLRTRDPNLILSCSHSFQNATKSWMRQETFRDQVLSGDLSLPLYRRCQNRRSKRYPPDREFLQEISCEMKLPTHTAGFPIHNESV